MKSATFELLDAAVRAALLSARAEAGLTQRELAAQLDLPGSYIGKIETAARRTTVSDFILIALAVETDPARMIRQIVAAIRS